MQADKHQALTITLGNPDRFPCAVTMQGRGGPQRPWHQEGKACSAMARIRSCVSVHRLEAVSKALFNKMLKKSNFLGTLWLGRGRVPLTNL